MKNQVAAFLITLLIVLSVVIYFIGFDNLKSYLPDIKFDLPDWSSKDKNSSASANIKTGNTKKGTYNSAKKEGEVIDVFNGVNVYYNGSVGNVYGRNTSSDGYNLGLRYQCVEFVKRYYYEYFGHKMPDSYGHAKDFYNRSLSDGSFNRARGLTQFRNGSSSKPKTHDIVIIGPSSYNQFGHVVIVSEVGRDYIRIVQQNPGKYNSTRELWALSKNQGKWYISESNVLGWLRKN